MIVSMNHRNHADDKTIPISSLLLIILVIVLLFINSSELSAVISSDEFTKSEIVLIISTIPLFHWNNHTKKMLESLNLLGPWTKIITTYEFFLL